MTQDDWIKKDISVLVVWGPQGRRGNQWSWKVSFYASWSTTLTCCRHRNHCQPNYKHKHKNTFFSLLFLHFGLMKLGFSKRSSWLPLLSLLILKRDLRNHRTYSQRLFIEELNANTGAHCHLTLSCCHCQHLDLCGLKACLRSWQSNILIENRVFLLLTWFDHFLIFAWQLEVPITKEKL